jgi:vacuolar-type H+-ATPase subunit H
MCLLIEDAAKSEAASLQSWSRNAATFLRDIRSVEQLFTAAISEIEDDAQQQMQEARTYFHNLRKAIEASEDLVMEEIASKTRDEVAKLQRASNAVSSRVSEIDDLHQRSQRIVSVDRWDASASALLLKLVEQAFAKWDVTTLPNYELTSVYTKAFPTPSQIAAATNQCVVRREGSINLPEAIDVNYLQQMQQPSAK